MSELTLLGNGALKSWLGEFKKRQEKNKAVSFTHSFTHELAIRPSKRKTRFVIDNEYLSKGYGAIFPNSVTVVYCVLAKYANYRKQTCFPAIETIMKEAGIRNRNTAFNAIKILEAHRLIAVNHSRGKSSNNYAMLDCSLWKEAGSISIDTILKTKKKETVSKDCPQQYQNDHPNSIKDDTRNHISKSYKEIKKESSLSLNREEDSAYKWLADWLANIGDTNPEYWALAHVRKYGPNIVNKALKSISDISRPTIKDFTDELKRA